MGSSPLARGGRVRTLESHVGPRLIPLARGGRVDHPSADLDVRLIPAGAGRTASPATAATGRAAHPRWRGADAGRVSHFQPVHGSSPLARGGPGGVGGSVAAVGLIPAGAGRTFQFLSVGSGCGAHPRWRGADSSLNRPGSRVCGSSPLARGGPDVKQMRIDADGLIPAGAGRTWPPRRSRPGTRAHPRWRGADTPVTASSWPSVGSSPLARGGPQG